MPSRESSPQLQPTALGRTIELAGRLLPHAGRRMLVETTAAALLKALADEHGSPVARCRSFTSGLPRRFRAHPVGHPIARDRIVVWSVCAMAGSGLVGASAHGLGHGYSGTNAAVLFASLAIVVTLLTALRRHRLSRAEGIRVAVWSIGLSIVWLAIVTGAIFVRLAQLGLW